MELDDRMSIVTPEGVVLEMTLAGVASRYAAALLDVMIQGVVIVGLQRICALGPFHSIPF